jgi:hypothetical protein
MPYGGSAITESGARSLLPAHTAFDEAVLVRADSPITSLVASAAPAWARVAESTAGFRDVGATPSPAFDGIQATVREMTIGRRHPMPRDTGRRSALVASGEFGSRMSRRRRMMGAACEGGDDAMRKRSAACRRRSPTVAGGGVAQVDGARRFQPLLPT